ncbi:MAG: DUF4815 domain-containing protein [Thermodesulfobacteriota bacterium]
MGKRLADYLHDYKVRTFDPLDSPVLAPPVVEGQSGAGTYTYAASFTTLVGETGLSDQATISTGPAVLNGFDKIRLEVQDIPAGVKKVRYWKRVGEDLKLLGEVDPSPGRLYDQGQSVSQTTVPPAANNSGRPGVFAVCPKPGQLAQRQSWMDLQANYARMIQDIGDTIFKQGDVISGCIESPVSGTIWAFTAGRIYFLGHILDVPAGTVTLTGTGIEKVGLTVTPTYSTPDDDPVQRAGADEGVAPEYALTGPDWLLFEVAWVKDQAGQIDIKTFEDNTPTTKTIPLERTELDRTFARRTRDVSGDFVVRPFMVSIEEHPTDPVKLRAKIGPGLAYPEGWEIETYKTRHVEFPRARDVEARNNSSTDVFDATGGAATGTATEPFDVDGLNVKVKVGSGNSHTVALTGNGQTAAQVATQIANGVNTYPSAESAALVTCTAVSGRVQIRGRNGHALTIEAVAADAYTVLGLTAGTYAVQGTRIYQVNDAFVKTVSDLNYPCETVDSVTHNGATHKDALSNTGVFQIIGAANSEADCRDGKFDYHFGVDFGRSGDYIDFSLYGGAEPASGATCYVKSRYQRNGIKGVRNLVRVVDAQVVKGAEDGQDTLVFTGASATEVVSGNLVTGLSGSASDVVRILRVNDNPGQSTSQYSAYRLLKNTTALGHSASQIDWSQAGPQGQTPGGQPNTTVTYYVSFEYWKHSVEGDFVAADSYDAYEEIEPAPNGVWKLRDCLDFRTVAGALPIHDDNLTFDYEFFLSRVDKLTVDSGGAFARIEGPPAVNPVFPSDQTGKLTFAVLEIAPYTYTPADVTVITQGPIRITQTGLEALKRRVERLEYWQTINDLERSVAYSDAAVGSKGIFTDALTGHNRGDVAFNKGGVKYSVALDAAAGVIRLQAGRTQRLLTVDENASTGVRRAGNSLLLDFQPSVYQAQTLASETMNVNPDEVFSFANGRLILSPGMDVFVDTAQAPQVVADYDDNIASAVALMSPEDLNRITWGDWVWTGQQIEGVGSRFTRAGVSRSIVPDRQEVDLGDRIVDLSVVPMMRTTKDGLPFEIQVIAASLMPNADHACTIDGKPVDLIATGTSLPGTAQYQGKTTVRSSAAGGFTGKFVMPAGVPTGQRLVRVFHAGDQVSEAATNFFSSGFRATRQNTVLGMTSAVVRTENLADEKWVGWDPLAQTFMIAEGPVYIAGVGGFFATKSATAPITCEIRRVINGYPSRQVIATRLLEPADVLVSADGSAETVFWFNEVVGYLPGEYCIVFLANSVDYTMFVAGLGGIDLLSGNVINHQSHEGVLFHSPNGSTWEAMTRHDLKFRLYKANFENECQVMFQSLSGIEASILVARITQFLAPGTNARWSYSLDNGASWRAFNPVIDTALGTIITAVKLRCDVTSAGGSFQVVDQYAGILFLLHELSGDYVGNQIQFADPAAYPNQVCAVVDADTDGVNGAGTRSITPYYSVDDGLTWAEMTPPAGFAPTIKTEPFYEWEFRTPDTASISGATNASPIVVTSLGHGFRNNAVVVISGVGGNTAANGTWRVANRTADTFALVDPATGVNSSGNGAYTTGGTVELAPFDRCRLRLLLTTTNKAQTPQAANIRMTCNQV